MTNQIKTSILFDVLALIAIGFGAYQLWGIWSSLLAIGAVCYWRHPFSNPMNEQENTKLQNKLISLEEGGEDLVGVGDTYLNGDAFTR